MIRVEDLQKDVRAPVARSWADRLENSPIQSVHRPGRFVDRTSMAETILRALYDRKARA